MFVAHSVGIMPFVACSAHGRRHTLLCVTCADSARARGDGGSHGICDLKTQLTSSPFGFHGPRRAETRVDARTDRSPGRPPAASTRVTSSHKRYIPDPSLKRQTPRATGSPNLDLGILPSPFAQPFECPSLLDVVSHRVPRSRQNRLVVESPLIEDVFVCCTSFLRMYFHRVSSRHSPSPLTHQDAARITQGLLLTSSRMAKSQKKPGGGAPSR